MSRQTLDEKRQICQYVQKLFMEREYSDFFSHQLESFDNYIDKVLSFLQSDENPAHNLYPFNQPNDGSFFKIKMINPTITKPQFQGQQVTPDICFQKHINYESSIQVDSIQLIKYKLKEQMNSMEYDTILCGEYKNIDRQPIEIFKQPIMVRTKNCSLSDKDIKTFVDPHDPGCFFIMSGAPKAITSIERQTVNETIVYGDKKGYVAVVQSQDFNPHYTNKNQFKVHMAVDQSNQYQSFTISTSQFSTDDQLNISEKMQQDEGEQKQQQQQKSIHLFLFLTALGFESDEQIYNACHFNNEKVKNFLENVITQYRQSHPCGKIYKQNEAFEELKKFKTKKIEQKKIEQIFLQDVLPHVSGSTDLQINLTQKAQYICSMVYKILLAYNGQTDPKTRDDYCFKRVITPGELLFEQFEIKYKKLMKDMRKQIYKQTSKDNMDFSDYSNIIQIVLNSKNTITKCISDAIKVGKFGKMKGISKQLPASSLTSKISILRMTSNVPLVQGQQIALEMKYVNANQMGYYCPIESPDGGNIGMLKNLCITAEITMDMMRYRNKIAELIYKNAKTVQCIPYTINNINKGYVNILIQGCFSFLCADICKLVEFLREQRFLGNIPKKCSFKYSQEENEFCIYLDSGRLTRPLIVVNQNGDFNYSLEQIQKAKTYKQLLDICPRLIEYIDIQEQQGVVIAPNQDDLQTEVLKRQVSIQTNKEITVNVDNRYANVFKIPSHCEIDKINVYGFLSSTQPYATTNMGTRQVFAFAQIKRSIQKPFRDNQKRNDISYYLVDGEQPLVASSTQSLIHQLTNPNGFNVLVATMMFKGFQQEDSITISSRMLQLYQQCKQDCIVLQIFKQRNQNREIITKPKEIDTEELQDANYDKIGDDGYPIVGEVYGYGDIILGKVKLDLHKEVEGDKQYQDTSIKHTYNNEAIVTDVIKIDKGTEIKVIIKYIFVLYPQIGDKFAQRAGQKGTIATIKKENEMPQTRDGKKIHVIINPHSFPKRKTLGYQIEQYTSFLAIFGDNMVNATPFQDPTQDIEATIMLLHKKFGYSIDGKRIRGLSKIYDPQTGKKMGQVMISYCFYSTLEQKASSKMYAIGLKQASRSNITRAPREGRTKNGGMRIGEMEGDELISAGQTDMIYELSKNHSDGCEFMVCECGRYAQFMPGQNIYYCSECEGNSKIYRTYQQYSTRLNDITFNCLGIENRLYVEQD